MEELLRSFFATLPGFWLAVVIAASLAVLGRSADWLVDEAVALSERSGIPKVVVGATIVSLGTTTPETAVSVVAALQGEPGLALGNAVGSIICDTGLILGLGCLLAPIKLDRTVVNRQGWLQAGAALALVAASIPWRRLDQTLAQGGHLPQFMGWIFVAALAAYLWLSVRWVASHRQSSLAAAEVALVEFHEKDVQAPVAWILVKLVLAIALVVTSAKILIPAVVEAAERLQVPQSIIAATVVAFGTSLPELVTVVTAALRQHGDLAVGNVIGADILNVLFVTGTATAVTRGGLAVDPHFFLVLYPLMLLVLAIFRVGIFLSGDYLRRPFGILLLASYAIYLVVSYVIPGVN